MKLTIMTHKTLEAIAMMRSSIWGILMIQVSSLGPFHHPQPTAVADADT